MFRMLSEEHIPFGVVDNTKWLGVRDVDLVVATGVVPEALEQYVREGGRLLIASSTAPLMDMGKVIKRWQDPDGAYFRVRDKSIFPSLKKYRRNVYVWGTIFYARLCPILPDEIAVSR
jgi:hypothetical protein